MGVVVRTLWDAIGDATGRTCSWLGFYVGPGETTPDGVLAGAGELLLAVREPKPACSPIGMHGAGGRCYTTRETLVIEDVARLGDGYIACDPRDVSELVVACVDEYDSVWGVFDLDAFDAGAFSKPDAVLAHGILRRAGLTFGPAPVITIV